jgi:hypothetical protein
MMRVLLVRLCSLTGKFKLSICKIGGNVTHEKIQRMTFSMQVMANNIINPSTIIRMGVEKVM